MLKQFKMIASGYLFFVRDGEILLSRRYNTGYEDGKYSVPAGHVEEGESITETTVREAREEIGIEVKPTDLVLVHVMHRREKDIRMDFFFTTKRWKGEPINKEAHKCDDLRWFPLGRLPGNTIPYIRQAISLFQQDIVYSERGF